ncbi:hypothetical protein PQX77_017305 [Marasmius sp. AFHP31]|nr:hypothetical protein PQX77_017305 [Marasmius sp. AFHP31]
MTLLFKNSHQIINDLQQHNELLRSKLQEVLVEKADLKTQMIIRGSRRGRKGKAPERRNAPFARDVVLRFGKSWCVNGGPWISSEAFGRYPDSTMPDPQSLARFQTPETYVAGTIVHLHRFLGNDTIRTLAAENTTFKNEFISEVNAQHSTSLNVLRKAIGSIFHDFSVSIPLGLWAQNCFQQRADNEILGSLLAPPNGTTAKLFSAILFPDQKFNTSLLFMNEIQPKILRCIYFGPGSLDGGGVNRATLLGNAWGIRRINGSAIAFSAMILQYLLSGDETLEPVGQKTKLDYWKNFTAFQQLIEVAVSASSPWATALFKYYNERVFKGLRNAGESEKGTEAEAHDNAVTQAMLQLTLGTSSWSVFAFPSSKSDTETPPAATTPSAGNATPATEATLQVTRDPPHANIPSPPASQEQPALPASAEQATTFEDMVLAVGRSRSVSPRPASEDEPGTVTSTSRGHGRARGKRGRGRGGRGKAASSSDAPGAVQEAPPPRPKPVRTSQRNKN